MTTFLMHAMAANHESKIPHCAEHISALKACHTDMSFISQAFLGVCNDAKYALVACMAENKQLWIKERQKEAEEKKLLDLTPARIKEREEMAKAIMKISGCAPTAQEWRSQT